MQALGHPGHCCVRPGTCAAVRIEVTWEPKKLKLDVRASFLIFFFFFCCFIDLFLKLELKQGILEQGFSSYHPESIVTESI